MLATRIAFVFFCFAASAIAACSSGDPTVTTDVDPLATQACTDDHLPSCKPGDDFADDDDACKADGGVCYAVSTCKYTLYCKPAK